MQTSAWLVLTARARMVIREGIMVSARRASSGTRQFMKLAMTSWPA